jgi:pimeloyl-ACP methyl ester carboxylesterase
MPRFLFVAFISLFFVTALSSQVYHFETGKVLGIGEANQIVWKKGVFNNYPADYGTLIVKENRNSRSSRLINIPVIRIKSASDVDTLPPIFLLHGGPGESNLQSHLLFDDVAQYRDIVLVGYRGVDGSVKLDCPCMANALLSDALSLNNAEKLFKLAVDSCLTNWKASKIDISGYSMDEVIEDIEITRKLLGYAKIDFLAFSYGSMLAQLYNGKYSRHVTKMAMIGARPLNKFLFEGGNYNNQIYKLFKAYGNYSEVKVISKEEVLSNVDKLLSSIKKRDTVFNTFRFYYFGISKLYNRRS